MRAAAISAGSISPGESAWAELREAQAMTLSLPRTGMAVAIDIGEGEDIHPKNKKDVLDIIVRKIGIAADQAETLYTIGVPTIYQPTLDKQIVGRTLKTYLAAGVITGQAPAYSFLVADFAR